MVAAVIEMKSWMGTTQNFLEGESPYALVEAFEKEQDLHCLAMMGDQYEKKAKGKKEVIKLNQFLDKYDMRKLTMDDIKEFSFELSVGSCRCLGIAEGEEKIKELREEFPNAK